MPRSITAGMAALDELLLLLLLLKSLGWSLLVLLALMLLLAGPCVAAGLAVLRLASSTTKERPRHVADALKSSPPAPP